jgi:serine/threonine protein kinase
VVDKQTIDTPEAEKQAPLSGSLEQLETHAAQTSSEFAPHTIFAEKFEVLEELGHGATGRVFKVRHVALGTMMALKVLRKDPSGDTAKRFVQEARVISRLRHPNIVAVHDFGTHNGHAFLAMDYLDGQSLFERLSTKGPLDTATFSRLMLQVCGALSHAHEQTIIHRDIKPSNIMLLERPDGTQEAMIVDFGLAKLDSEENKQSLTKTGAVLGTPVYMSPEQLQGYEVDARADIYSLGCVMYESLTGVSPHDKGDVFAIMFSHLNEAPAAFPKKIRSQPAAKQLEAIILKCMAKSADDRYQSVLQLAAAIKDTARGGNNIWNSFGESLKVAGARNKCQPKNSRWSRSALQCCSAVAILCALIMSTVPTEIQRAAMTIECDTEIAAVLNDLIVQMGEETKDDVANISPSELRGFAKRRFGEILQQYPEVAGKYKVKMEASLFALRRVVQTSGAVFKRLLANDFFAVKPAIQKTMTAWVETANSFNALKQGVYGERAEASIRFSFYAKVLLIATAAAAISELGLLCLFIGSWRQQMEQRKTTATLSRVLPGS